MSAGQIFTRMNKIEKEKQYQMEPCGPNLNGIAHTSATTIKKASDFPEKNTDT